MSLLVLSPTCYCQAWCHMVGTGSPFGLFGPLTDSCPPQASWLLAGRWRRWKALTFCKHSSASAKTLVSYETCSSLKCKAQQATVEKADLITSCQKDPVPTLMEKKYLQFSNNCFPALFFLWGAAHLSALFSLQSTKEQKSFPLPNKKLH